jgi:hypothetical protein
MANIRVPVEAKTLLPLCRKHEQLPGDPELPICFDTYADLIVFCAAYGFSELDGRIPERKTKFLDRPNPIDLAIFKTDRRFPQILLIALAASGDKNVVRDEETMSCLIEDFTAVGCERIAKSITLALASSPHLSIGEILKKADGNQL